MVHTWINRFRGVSRTLFTKSRFAKSTSTVGAVALAGAFLVGVMPGTAGASSSVPIAMISEPFTGSQVQVPTDWDAIPGPSNATNYACLTAGTSSGETPIPKCSSVSDTAGSGALRMTAATASQEGGVVDTRSLPSSDGLDITFQTYQYGGNGADGIMFFLAGTNPADPTPPAALGEAGGHLAYSGGSGSPAGNGMVNGYMGIGFDVFGNYTNNAYDGSGCSDPSWAGSGTQVANTVSVRGPGSGTAGYCLLSSTKASGSLSGNLGGSSSATRAHSLVPAEVAINPTATAYSTTSGLSVPAYSYVVAVTPIGGRLQTLSGTLPYDSYLKSSDPSWIDPTTGIPKQFYFGFAASTGGSDDVHEVSNVNVEPLVANAPQYGLTLSDSGAGSLLTNSSVTYTASPTISTSGGTESIDPQLITTFPTGVTPGTASGGSDWSCTTSSQTVTCNFVGTLGSGPMTAVSMPATVSSGASGALTASSTIWEAGAVVAQANDTGSAISSAPSTPTLGVSLADDAAGQLTQGESVTYTASPEVSANGGAETVHPALDISLPGVGATPSMESFNGTPTGTDWTCAAPSGSTDTCIYNGSTPVSAGSSLTDLSIPVTIGTDATGALPMSVTLTDSSTSVSVTDYSTVVSTPTLSLTLHDNLSGDYAVNGTVDFTATGTVVSPGWNEADPPVITDTFPAVFTAVSVGASSTDWTCSQSTGTTITETCTYLSSLLPLAAGSTLQQLGFVGTVSNSASVGTNANDSASIVSNDAPVSMASDFARVGEGPSPNLSLTSSAPANSTSANYTLAITAGVAGTGGGTTLTPTMTAVAPSNVTFVSAPTPSGWSCSLSGGKSTLTCQPTTATNAAGTTFPNIDASMTATSNGLHTTQLTFADSSSPDSALTVSTSSTTDVAAPVLDVPTSGTPASAYAGSSYTWDINPALDASGGPAFNTLTLTTTLPSGLTFTGSNPATGGWACGLTSSSLTCTYSVSSSSPVAAGTSLGTLAPTVSIGSSTSGTKNPSVSLADSSDGATTATSSASMQVSDVPSLSLSTSGTPSKAYQGGSYTLTLTPSIGSSGGPASNHPQLTVTLPTGEAFPATAPAPSGWTCAVTNSNTVLTCNSTMSLPVAPGTSLGTVMATVDIASNSPLTSLQTSAALADSADSASPSTAGPSVTVQAPPVLDLTDSGTPALGIAAGASYTLALTPSLDASGGPADSAPSLVVTLPTGESFSSTAPTPSGWSCSVGGTGDTQLSCNSTTSLPIAAGTALGPVTDLITVASSARGSLVTTASLSDSADLATAATVTPSVTATAAPVLSVSTSGTPTHAYAGGSYTLNVSPALSNTGGPAYHDPTLDVTLPTGESFPGPAPSAAGWSCSLSGSGGVETTLLCSSSAALSISSGTNLGSVSTTVDITSGTTGTLQTSAALSDPTETSIVTASPSVVASLPPQLVLTSSGTPASRSAGTSYSLTMTPSLGGAGGPAYSEPMLSVALPTGESFPSTAPTSSGWSCGVSGTRNTVLTCTSTATLPIASGTALGPVTATVQISVATTGSLQATGVLSDPSDLATSVDATPSAQVTETPCLVVSTAGTPGYATPGENYMLYVTAATAASPSGGPAYNEPQITVQLPTDEIFMSMTSMPTGWTCALSADNTSVTCTSTASLPIAAGTQLGSIYVDVHIGASPNAPLTTVVTLSDTSDAATPVQALPASQLAGTTTTASSTPPVLKLDMTAPSSAQSGSSFQVSVTPSLSSTGGSANSAPAFGVTMPAGETVGSVDAGTNWSCSVTTSSTAVACQWTGALPQAAGTTLDSVRITIKVSNSASGSLLTPGLLADGGDSAASTGSSLLVKIIPGTSGLDLGGYGYRLVGSDGGVFDFGNAHFHGSCEVKGETCNRLNGAAVGMANTSDGQGYWLVGADGGVFTYGDARFHGSCLSVSAPCGQLKSPVVAIAATPDNAGYWLVGAKGAVFAFGDAHNYGSLTSRHVSSSIVGVAATPDGHGYWMVTPNGAVYAFGNAVLYGSCTQAGSRYGVLTGPIVGINRTPDGHGYWLVGSDGGVFTFGDAQFLGNTYTAKVEDQLVGPVVGMTVMADGHGYWLVAQDGGVFAFGEATFLGNTRTARVEPILVGRVTGIAYSAAG